ncbi:hypothetical protein ACFL27_25005 [candidate division CSSED10-310 bacterium]|uniref:ABC transporter permease n=1 Tax=candidate division CSSED10-310 bacterium TaxID=2855610 RepID=A0ABV6Z4X3_UNCC1
MKLDLFRHESFNLRTMQSLILSDFRSVRNQVMLTLGITYGIYLLPKLNKYVIMARFMEFSTGPVDLPLPLFPLYITLFICVIFTANIFSAIYAEKQSMFYFTLPASISEKLCSKLFISLVLFYLISFLSMILFFFLHYFLGMLGNLTVALGNLRTLDAVIFTTFFYYLFFHSIYFFCSLFWKRNAFLKTSFLIFAVIAVFFTLYLVGGIILFQRSVIADFSNIDPLTENFGQNIDFFRNILSKLSKFIFYGLPLLLYFLSFIHLKKKQISE